MYFLALQIIEIFYVINPAVQDRTSALFVRFMSHPVTEEHLPSSLMKFYTGAISTVITYHNPENMPKDGICVANHTSPIDVLILACDNAYALVRKGGISSGN